MMDYWTSSLEQKALIGLNEKGEKLLVKSEEEYTSTIAKIYKVADEFIIMTENSLYIVIKTHFRVYRNFDSIPYGGFENFYMEIADFCKRR